jgi:hydroxymethylpyrimidine pyrophosphatase-like HAD family hydrolase
MTSVAGLPAAPVDRKLSAAALPADSPVRRVYELALGQWLEGLGRARFGGVVLDYDGTVCPSGAGHDPPPAPVRDVLLRLLEAGCALGFASGRGRSLHRELRLWVPRPHWDRVLVGMYTGGVRVALSQDISHTSEIPRRDLSGEDAAALAETWERLRSPVLSGLFDIDRRLGQITVKSLPAAPLTAAALHALAAAVVRRPPTPPVTLAASGHAVDVVPAAVTKAAVVREIAAALGEEVVLAVGDQGQPDGNDFDLLAATPFTLSVDRCSADPTRCWNLLPSDRQGPDGLVAYLERLTPAPGGGLRLDWPGG